VEEIRNVFKNSEEIVLLPKALNRREQIASTIEFQSKETGTASVRVYAADESIETSQYRQRAIEKNGMQSVCEIRDEDVDNQVISYDMNGQVQGLSLDVLFTSDTPLTDNEFVVKVNGNTVGNAIAFPFSKFETLVFEDWDAPTGLISDYGYDNDRRIFEARDVQIDGTEDIIFELTSCWSPISASSMRVTFSDTVSTGFPSGTLVTFDLKGNDVNYHHKVIYRRVTVGFTIRSILVERISGNVDDVVWSESTLRITPARTGYEYMISTFVPGGVGRLTLTGENATNIRLDTDSSSIGELAEVRNLPSSAVQIKQEVNLKVPGRYRITNSGGESRIKYAVFTSTVDCRVKTGSFLLPIIPNNWADL
jgi:hypothetical protein